MAWKCDVCGKGIHLKKIDNKNYPVRCPLEKYRNVKGFYTCEFNQMINYIFFEDFMSSNNPSDLESFSKMIPDETPLMDYVKKFNDEKSKLYKVYTKTLIIQSNLETFFSHYNRCLIDIYDDNKIHFIDSPRIAGKEQFNYLWLSPTTLRECYFGGGNKDSRFKRMTDFGNPSLVIYPIGIVQSITHGGWGDILLDLITHRQSLGKPTWIVKSKEFNKCQEISSSENLRSYLSRSSSIPTVILDEDCDLISENISSNSNSKSNGYNL